MKLMEMSLKSIGAPTIDMTNDLKRLENPLERIIGGKKSDSAETKIVFDNFHLSPLKVS